MAHHLVETKFPGLQRSARTVLMQVSHAPVMYELYKLYGHVPSAAFSNIHKQCHEHLAFGISSGEVIVNCLSHPTPLNWAILLAKITQIKAVPACGPSKLSFAQKLKDSWWFP